MSHQYEIEIKSLLGDEQNAKKLREKLVEKYPDLQTLDDEKQLNHYFNSDGDFQTLRDSLLEYFDEGQLQRLDKILADGKKFSLRTRDANGTVLFVIKASIDDTTSENGITRIEFEEVVPLTIEELDKKIESAGFTYQAKWSREREAYSTGNMNVTIDKNAGYGYLAEFERVVGEEGDAEAIRNELRSVMDELDVEELAQDRLERMFAFYNDNWAEYYGTDKTFTIE